MKLRMLRGYGSPNAEFDKQLLNFFEQNKNQEAQAILQKNPELLKTVDHEGSTLLHHAAKYNNNRMVKYLINSGMNVNIQNRRGRSAIMDISLDIDVDSLIITLLKANAFLHLRDVDGVIGLKLILAASSDRINIAELCTRNLVAHYSKDFDKIAQLYLECSNPMYHSFYSGYPMLTRSLLKQGYPVNQVVDSTNGDTALHIAVNQKDVERVKILLDFGADVNALNDPSYGITPLDKFRRSNIGCPEMLEIIELLLDRGAFMTILQENSESFPVDGIMCFGSRKEIQLLLRYNLNLRARDADNLTPVHLLALNSCENIMEELQGKDFEVNARDSLERVPLHYAAGNNSSVKFLLKNGADVSALDKDGLTPLHFAFITDDEDKRLGVQCDCDIRSVEILLESGADPQAEALDGTTVVHQAVRLKQWSLVKPVLAHLAMIQARGQIITERILSQIACHELLKESFDYYAGKLKRMKSVTIWESINMHHLLMESEDKLSVYMRNRDLVLRLARINKKCKFNSNYYFDLIQRRMEKILQRTQIKSRATAVMCKLLEMHYGGSHIIVDSIVDYLNDEDLLTLIHSLDIR